MQVALACNFRTAEGHQPEAAHTPGEHIRSPTNQGREGRMRIAHAPPWPFFHYHAILLSTNKYQYNWW